jgi:L-ascorbate metabolism protein UlaG (beta-lactamase superfamily)
LIDGLTCADGLYPSTSDEDRQAIQSGIAPFEALDLMIFTHEHADHFDPDACAKFINKNKGTIVMMNRASFFMIGDKIDADAKSRILVPKCATYTIGPSTVTVYALAHDGGILYEDVEHFAVLIELDGRTILHTGDAGFKDADVTAYEFPAKKIDWMITAFPNIGLPNAREKVREQIAPHHIMAVHFPLPEADGYGWTKATKESVAKIKWIDHERGNIPILLLCDGIGEEFATG